MLLHARFFIARVSRRSVEPSIRVEFRRVGEDGGVELVEMHVHAYGSLGWGSPLVGGCYYLLSELKLQVKGS